jgi:hypothetical protein
MDPPSIERSLRLHLGDLSESSFQNPILKTKTGTRHADCTGRK